MTLSQDDSQPTASTSSEPVRQFEFSPEEGQLFGNLAEKMRFVGLLTSLIGALALLYAALLTIGGRGSAPLLVICVAALLLILIGVWMQKAGGEFLLIEETAGKDISHLMQALANLHKLFALQYWIGWIGLILLIVAMVFGYFIDPAH